ncbi:hypothetical protein CBS101457_004590 [Exobasidium rhododendri]|nr:hypothetical protein CBS101457_004590 [Exobasidium rhododendri]
MRAKQSVAAAADAASSVLTKNRILQADASSTTNLYPDIVQANLTQPLDHFDPSNNITFSQRYWYSLRHYRPVEGKATPIFVLDSGETDAAGRLPYLDHGILDILANATGGIGVILEHRYYGASYPLRSDLGKGERWGVDELRWLNNRQALEDSAQFVQKMTFPETGNGKLNAPHEPVIYYGGSYPGARSAHMRVLYPHLIFGAIASSAVVAAIEEFPDYFYPISRGAQQDCSQAIQASIAWMDEILAPEPWKGQHQTSQDTHKVKELLTLFGLQGLKETSDFANLLSFPLGSFQELNWDPSVSTNDFAEFCTALVGESSGPVSPAPQRRSTAVRVERRKSSQSVLDLEEEDDDSLKPPQVVRNFADYIKKNYVEACTSDNTSTVEDCFGTQDWSAYNNATELSDGLSWTFQYCSTWGYFMTAPPIPKEGHSPRTFQLSSPKLISSLIDLEYTSEVCRKGFPAGQHFAMPKHPNVKEVNEIGNFHIAKDRLAFINGQYDPWRPATTASEEYAYGGARIDTISQPFKLIANCWHHCDENGNKTEEPPRVVQIHEQQIAFVQAWLDDWKA